VVPRMSEQKKIATEIVGSAYRSIAVAWPSPETLAEGSRLRYICRVDSPSLNVAHTSEKTTGFRRIFSAAPIYRFAQWAIGASHSRTVLTTEILQIAPDDKVLDIGCGTADILADFPPTVDYLGFDPSDAYVLSATKRFGSRAIFTTASPKYPEEYAPDRMLTMAIGVFHHLSDDGVRTALSLAKSSLGPSGRFVSIDPTLVAGQHKIAAFLAKRDRGQHVRSPEAMSTLVYSVFPEAKISVRHDLLRVPYSHVVVEA
jgi:SAM-dependent methyltransferase